MPIEFINILTVFGIATIISKSNLFEPIRNKTTGKFNELLNCILCTSFHIGYVYGSFYGPFSWWNLLCNGAFYSGSSWILNALVVYLGAGDYPVKLLNISKDNND